MNTSQNFDPKRNAMMQNKPNARSSATPSRACTANYKNGATRTTGSQGPAPTRVRSSVPQPQPSNMVYGNGNMNSSQMLRPPAGLPSHLQRRPSATPSSSSYRSYQPPMNNKSPRYRKPPVSQTHLQKVPQKVTRPAVSCGNLDQQQRCQQQVYEQQQMQQQQVQQTRSEPGEEAGGDYTNEIQQLQISPEVEEVPQPSFVERYMNHMKDKLTNDRQNDFRWDWPSAAVGDVKMDIARVLQATDIEQNEDPTRPRGHVTILPETCQITLQALRNKYEVLSQEYNALPMESDTLRTRNRRALLERELTQIEEGLHVFSRNRVHVRDLSIQNEA